MGRASSLSLSASPLLLSVLWSLALCPDFFPQRGHGLGPIPTAPTMSLSPTLGRVGICYPKEWEQVQEAMTPQEGPQVASLSCAEQGGCPASPSAPPASVTASRGPRGISATACVSSGNGVRGRKVLLVHLRGCVSMEIRGQVHRDGRSLLRPLQAKDGTDQHEQDGHLQERQENVVVPARGYRAVRALGPPGPRHSQRPATVEHWPAPQGL